MIGVIPKERSTPAYSLYCDACGTQYNPGYMRGLYRPGSVCGDYSGGINFTLPDGCRGRLQMERFSQAVVERRRHAFPETLHADFGGAK